LLTQLHETVHISSYFPIATGDITDASDTAPLLIFIGVVNDEFDVIAMRGTTGKDLYERLSTTLQRHKMWNKLINMRPDR